MAVDEQAGVERELIEKLIAAREVPAVMKSRLAALRAVDPDVCVIAFEGIDDKTVYFHWIKEIAPNFVYEPFVCKGKTKVLQLKKMLEHDLGELSRAVVFVVDRDFDDLRGHDSSENIFMTQSYSFENYLVSEKVLDELLKNELHCHGELSCRAKVLELFKKQYANFLTVTADLNFRIFISRKCSISQENVLPKSINKVANVSLFEVSPAQETASGLVALQREPTLDELTRFKSEFAVLKPEERYRGKFAMLFFRKWLELITCDRNAASSRLFSGLDREGLVARGQYTLDSMAARASQPLGLKEFILRVAGSEV